MATTYLSPGVYVEEIPSGINPIAGVGTSTAGFLGMATDLVPLASVTAEVVGQGNGGQNQTFPLKNSPVLGDKTLQVRVDTPPAILKNEFTKTPPVASVVFTPAPAKGLAISCDYKIATQIMQEALTPGAGTPTVFSLKNPLLSTDPLSITVRINGATVTGNILTAGTSTSPATVTLATAPAAGASVTADYWTNLPGSSVTGEVVIAAANGTDPSFPLKGFPVLIDAKTFRVVGTDPSPTVKNIDGTPPQSKVTLSVAAATGQNVTVDYTQAVAPGMVRLCTNFSEFKKFFGDFSTVAGHNWLAQGVYGFFNNGGTRCYVVLVKDDAGFAAALDKMAPIDDIAIMAAPGVTSAASVAALITHCQQTTQDRFAILDCPRVVETSGSLDLTLLTLANPANVLPQFSNYAAFYFPWIQVFDPATNGPMWTPPSGHIAGVYARVDTNRGVHKAPANEAVLGALGLKYRISKPMQNGLNPKGVNCIRSLNGNIVIWGARTIGGDDNGEWKYINVRRLFLFLRKSIDQGTQWVVFEPNDTSLWAKITRNITAFLLNVWRSGALFGTTPQEAFYVKCDAETNPPERRDLGQVVTEIGVAVVKPAEFVIFRISQWAGPPAK